MKLRKKTLMTFLTVILLICVMGMAVAAKPYPNKNIFVYIFSSQGGGTDTWVRHLSALMERDLGVNIVCNNLPGANGGNGGMKVWNAPHDGYTVLGASETSMFFGVNDVAPTADQWNFFIAGGSPGVIAVHAKSPYQTIEDLVEAARKHPNQIKISDSGRGKLWNIKAIQLGSAVGVKFQHIPYNGSGPAITALLSREVDAVSCSAGEVIEYVRSGMLRPLVMTEVNGLDFENFGYVKPATDYYPSLKNGYSNLFQWLGFMMPADVPEEVVAAFGRAFEKALQDPKTDQFVRTQSSKKMGLWGAEAKTLALKMESVASWMSYELGLAKKPPTELGIAPLE